MRRAARPHSVKDAWNDDLARGIWSKNALVFVSTIAVYSICFKMLLFSRQTNASFQAPFQRPQEGICRSILCLCSLALVFFEESCMVMYICCLLMHICVLVVCCSCFCSIQMHPRFHHFSSQRKAPAHLQFRAKTPEKATKVWIVCYLNKSMHHSSFFPRHTSQCASPNWPHFCPQRGHQSCHVNSLFPPSHSVVYLFSCGLNAMNCIALRGSARFCVELVIRGHKESPKMT